MTRLRFVTQEILKGEPDSGFGDILPGSHEIGGAVFTAGGYLVGNRRVDKGQTMLRSSIAPISCAGSGRLVILLAITAALVSNSGFGLSSVVEIIAPWVGPRVRLSRFAS